MPQCYLLRETPIAKFFEDVGYQNRALARPNGQATECAPGGCMCGVGRHQDPKSAQTLEPEAAQNWLFSHQ